MKGVAEIAHRVAVAIADVGTAIVDVAETRREEAVAAIEDADAAVSAVDSAEAEAAVIAVVRSEVAQRVPMATVAGETLDAAATKLARRGTGAVRRRARPRNARPYAA